jgi:hypothetical protein
LKQVATGLVCIFSATVSLAACTNVTPVSQEMKDSEAIIIGTVMSASQVPQSWDSLDGTDYVVHIDRKVKGKQSGEITVFGEHSDNGFKMQTGEKYLLFLTNNYQHWVVNQCGNSGPMDEASPAVKQMVHAGHE